MRIAVSMDQAWGHVGSPTPRPFARRYDCLSCGRKVYDDAPQSEAYRRPLLCPVCGVRIRIYASQVND